jgi:hypothetical protein
MLMLVPPLFTLGVNCVPPFEIVAPVNVHDDPAARLRMILPEALSVAVYGVNVNCGVALGSNDTVTVMSGISVPG